MGQMPTIIHRGEKINTDNMTSFNLSWSYGDGAILTTERSNVMDIIYIGDGGYILKINVTYRVDARNIIQAKQEFLQFLSTDFDRAVDKKLGDYGFDSENINR